MRWAAVNGVIKQLKFEARRPKKYKRNKDGLKSAIMNIIAFHLFFCAIQQINCVLQKKGKHLVRGENPARKGNFYQKIINKIKF